MPDNPNLSVTQRRRHVQQGKADVRNIEHTQIVLGVTEAGHIDENLVMLLQIELRGCSDDRSPRSPSSPDAMDVHCAGIRRPHHACSRNDGAMPGGYGYSLEIQVARVLRDVEWTICDPSRHRRGRDRQSALQLDVTELVNRSDLPKHATVGVCIV